MIMNNNLTKAVGLIVSLSLLPACAAKHYDDGVIISEQKIVSPCQVASHPIKTAAGIGGLSGAIAGGTLGGLIGWGIADLTDASVLSCVAIGAGSGALFLGGVSAAVGAGGGLLYYGATYQNQPYEYKVRTYQTNEILTIQQNAAPIPVHTKVRILERSGSRFIRR